MMAVTMDNRKPLLLTLVKGKTARAERGLELTADSAHRSGGMTEHANNAAGRGQDPGYLDGHEIHVVLDCFSVHVSYAVRRTAERLRIRLHFNPPG